METVRKQPRTTIKVVRDEGDKIPRDRVLPVELPVLMRADAYLKYEDFKTMLEYQLRPTDPVERWYMSLPMFMKKGQMSKMSARKRKKAAKEINKLQARRNNRVMEVERESICDGAVGIEHVNSEGEPILNVAMHSKGGETEARMTDPSIKGPWKTKWYVDKDIPQLRKQWVEEYADIFQEQPERFPPPRSVKHRIPLKDLDKEHQYYAPKCPMYLRKELNVKVQKYLHAGWWIPCQTHQAAPMLCIAKKDFLLRTVMDLQKRNDNTYNDMTPLPDQETIHNDAAKARYRSKIDLSNAYEQVLVDDEYVKYTAFATIFGMFYSRVMQIGDCNAPAMFQ